MSETNGTSAYDAWNPGLESKIPDYLQPKITLFHPQNAFVEYDKAKELSEFFGLPASDFIALKPERLVIHELLFRVTADLYVPDGPNYADLGINLRSMVANIFINFVRPEIDQIETAYEQARNEAEIFVEAQLEEKIYAHQSAAPPTKKKSGFIARLFGSSKVLPPAPPRMPELGAVTTWQAELKQNDNPMQIACLKGLIKFVGSICGLRGRLVADRDLIKNLALNFACNSYGSNKIGEILEPILKHAAKQKNYSFLPTQSKPVVMNVKGASASGKSTIRPQQRELAGELGIPWQEFALISPDYWRKYLLDYESLGKDSKYAAMLTGQELEIIDKKLDHYMAQKASKGKMSHLLIDRFRFDSFTLIKNRSADSKLLTRFGDRVFMFFMVTPPEETVMRAWIRGQKTGRYKAVDDLLYHNIEAYEGMPELFFSWALSTEKKVHFEFLDNDVPEGDLPKTIAFGWNNSMVILDIESMINIDRFKKINIEALSPEAIFASHDLTPQQNLGFMSRCVELIEKITFVDQAHGNVFACVEKGKLIWSDKDYLDKKPTDSSVQIFLETLGYQSSNPDNFEIPLSLNLEHEKKFTFGQWY